MFINDYYPLFLRINCNSKMNKEKYSIRKNIDKEQLLKFCHNKIGMNSNDLDMVVEFLVTKTSIVLENAGSKSKLKITGNEKVD